MWWTGSLDKKGGRVCKKGLDKVFNEEPVLPPGAVSPEGGLIEVHRICCIEKK